MMNILRGIFTMAVLGDFLLAILIYQAAKMRKPEEPDENAGESVEIESAD